MRTHWNLYVNGEKHVILGDDTFENAVNEWIDRQPIGSMLHLPPDSIEGENGRKVDVKLSMSVVISLPDGREATHYAKTKGGTWCGEQGPNEGRTTDLLNVDCPGCRAALRIVLILLESPGERETNREEHP